jgi:hypothetical protein
MTGIISSEISQSRPSTLSEAAISTKNSTHNANDQSPQFWQDCGTDVMAISLAQFHYLGWSIIASG